MSKALNWKDQLLAAYPDLAQWPTQFAMALETPEEYLKDRSGGKQMGKGLGIQRDVHPVLLQERTNTALESRKGKVIGPHQHFHEKVMAFLQTGYGFKQRRLGGSG